MSSRNIKKTVGWTVCLLALLIGSFAGGLRRAAAMEPTEPGGGSSLTPIASALHFQPPIASGPSGDPVVADRSLLSQTVVHVCRTTAMGSDGTCTDASGIMASQSSSSAEDSRLRLSADSGSGGGGVYQSSWHAERQNVQVGERFRIQIRVAGLAIGSADVEVISISEHTQCVTGVLGGLICQRDRIPGTMYPDESLVIRFRVDNHPIIRARVLHDLDNSATQVAARLLQEFSLTRADAFAVLWDDIRNQDIWPVVPGATPYTADQVIEALANVYPSSTGSAIETAKELARLLLGASPALPVQQVVDALVRSASLSLTAPELLQVIDEVAEFNLSLGETSLDTANLYAAMGYIAAATAADGPLAYTSFDGLQAVEWALTRAGQSSDTWNSFQHMDQIQAYSANLVAEAYYEKQGDYEGLEDFVDGWLFSVHRDLVAGGQKGHYDQPTMVGLLDTYFCSVVPGCAGGSSSPSKLRAGGGFSIMAVSTAYSCASLTTGSEAFIACETKNNTIDHCNGTGFWFGQSITPEFLGAKLSTGSVTEYDALEVLNHPLVNSTSVCKHSVFSVDVLGLAAGYAKTFDVVSKLMFVHPQLGQQARLFSDQSIINGLVQSTKFGPSSLTPATVLTMGNYVTIIQDTFGYTNTSRMQLEEENTASGPLACPRIISNPRYGLASGLQLIYDAPRSVSDITTKAFLAQDAVLFTRLWDDPRLSLEALPALSYQRSIDALSCLDVVGYRGTAPLQALATTPSGVPTGNDGGKATIYMVAVAGMLMPSDHFSMDADVKPALQLLDTNLNPSTMLGMIFTAAREYIKSDSCLYFKATQTNPDGSRSLDRSALITTLIQRGTIADANRLLLVKELVDCGVSEQDLVNFILSPGFGVPARGTTVGDFVSIFQTGFGYSSTAGSTKSVDFDACPGLAQVPALLPLLKNATRSPSYTITDTLTLIKEWEVWSTTAPFTATNHTVSVVPCLDLAGYGFAEAVGPLKSTFASTNNDLAVAGMLSSYPMVGTGGVSNTLTTAPYNVDLVGAARSYINTNSCSRFKTGATPSITNSPAMGLLITKAPMQPADVAQGLTGCGFSNPHILEFVANKDSFTGAAPLDIALLADVLKLASFGYVGDSYNACASAATTQLGLTTIANIPLTETQNKAYGVADLLRFIKEWQGWPDATTADRENNTITVVPCLKEVPFLFTQIVEPLWITYDVHTDTIAVAGMLSPYAIADVHSALTGTDFPQAAQNYITCARFTTGTTVKALARSADLTALITKAPLAVSGADTTSTATNLANAQDLARQLHSCGLFRSKIANVIGQQFYPTAPTSPTAVLYQNAPLIVQVLSVTSDTVPLTQSIYIESLVKSGLLPATDLEITKCIAMVGTIKGTATSGDPSKVAATLGALDYTPTEGGANPFGPGPDVFKKPDPANPGQTTSDLKDLADCLVTQGIGIPAPVRVMSLSFPWYKPHAVTATWDNGVMVTGGVEWTPAASLGLPTTLPYLPTLATNPTDFIGSNYRDKATEDEIHLAGVDVMPQFNMLTRTGSPELTVSGEGVSPNLNGMKLIVPAMPLQGTVDLRGKIQFFGGFYSNPNGGHCNSTTSAVWQAIAAALKPQEYPDFDVAGENPWHDDGAARGKSSLYYDNNGNGEASFDMNNHLQCGRELQTYNKTGKMRLKIADFSVKDASAIISGDIAPTTIDIKAHELPSGVTYAAGERTAMVTCLAEMLTGKYSVECAMETYENLTYLDLLSNGGFAPTSGTNLTKVLTTGAP